MRHRSFVPTLDSLDLRIAPTTLTMPVEYIVLNPGPVMPPINPDAPVAPIDHGYMPPINPDVMPPLTI